MNSYDGTHKNNRIHWKKRNHTCYYDVYQDMYIPTNEQIFM